MPYASRPVQDWRRTRLIGPIAALTVGALILLAIISLILTKRFDATASEREKHVIEHGFTQLVEEHDAVVATQVGWDDAVRQLDQKRNADWADFNIGNYLHTFYGFSHSFVLDADDRPFYASVAGERAHIEAFAPFAPIVSQILPVVRAGERNRPPLRVRPGKNNIVVPPIQRNSFARIGGQVYIVTATLVQPDFGKYMPKGATAPVTITALPIDSALLRSFGERYLVDDLAVAASAPQSPGRSTFRLFDNHHRPVGAVVWQPRRPGSYLLGQLLFPLVTIMTLLCLSGWTIVRRSDSIVADLISSETRARHLAFHDSLTQLPNRAMLFDRLQRMLQTVPRTGKMVAVLCVDLDRFKEINDTLGHHAGDVVIETAAARLRQLADGNALIARLGGDEFVALFEVAQESCALDAAKSVIAAIEAPIASEYGPLAVSCSVGVALIDQAGVEATEALRWADLALYRSKEDGRGRFTLFEPEMDAALRNRRSLEADLRAALDDGTLRMEYQPQVDLDNRIIALEALVRWRHPDRGEIPPGVFVPLAEEKGLMLALGELVIRRVFHETADWQSVRVAINVSAEQMRAPGFAAQVARLAAEAGIDPRRYEMELTETALLGHETVTEANISALKRLGFSFALDDFGTGYSSLSVLQRFSVDRIKIDRSFVSCLGVDDESEALIDAMIKLARALAMTVIAEGVETQEQRSRLAACGCSEFQGYLTGRPLALADAKAVLSANAVPLRRRA